MANYDDIDLKFTYNGDYAIGHDGDLSSTEDDALQSLIQDVQSISNSDAGDWEFYPGRGATLSDFVGEPNSRTTGSAIHDRLKMALIAQGIVLNEDLDVKVVPISNTTVLIVVRIDAEPTPFNSLSEDKLLVVQLIFDFRERGVFFFKRPL